MLTIAVVILVGAAVSWVAPIRAGITMRGAFFPALYTYLGFFFLWLASRTETSSGSGESERGASTH